MGSGSDDPRSDGEEDEEDKGVVQAFEANKKLHVYPLEEEVGVDELKVGGNRSNPTRVFKKGSINSSGVSLPHDRKELLRRIGCDKQA